MEFLWDRRPPPPVRYYSCLEFGRFRYEYLLLPLHNLPTPRNNSSVEFTRLSDEPAPRARILCDWTASLFDPQSHSCVLRVQRCYLNCVDRGIGLFSRRNNCVSEYLVKLVSFQGESKTPGKGLTRNLRVFVNSFPQTNHEFQFTNWDSNRLWWDRRNKKNLMD